MKQHNCIQHLVHSHTAYTDRIIDTDNSKLFPYELIYNLLSNNSHLSASQGRFNPEQTK